MSRAQTPLDANRIPRRNPDAASLIEMIQAADDDYRRGAKRRAANLMEQVIEEVRRVAQRWAREVE